jgi:hypothetical protein
VLVLGLFLGIARACDSWAACPEDGANAHFTGETKFEGHRKFGRYSHVTMENKIHTFWAQCRDED